MNESLDSTSSSIIEEEEEEEFDEGEYQSGEQSKVIPTVAVPSSDFSGDLAVAILLLRWIPEYDGFQIIRTDDEEVINECTIRIGYKDGVCDHNRRIYAKRYDWNIPGRPNTMGVGGIIYHFYGERAIATHYNLPGFEEQSDFKFLIDKLYKCIIQPLDLGQDCDVSRLSKVLDPNDDPDPFVKNYSFEEFIELLIEQFDQRINWIINTMMPGRAQLRRAIEDRKKYLATGEILYITHYVPILPNVDIIDPDETKKQAIKYIVMGRITGDAIVHTFKWRSNFKHLGLRGKSGDQLTGLLQNISGSGWVHQNGTLAEWNSLANALEYTKQILKSTDKAP